MSDHQAKIIEREIRAILPSLLLKYKIPYSMKQIELKVESKSTRQIIAEGKDYIFETDSFEDKMILNACINPQVFQLLVYFFDKIYLEAVLVHELFHFFEKKLTPDQYYANVFTNISKGALKIQLDNVVNEFRDLIVNTSMPQEMFQYYKDFKFFTWVFDNVKDSREFIDQLRSLKQNPAKPLTCSLYFEKMTTFIPSLSTFWYLGQLDNQITRDLIAGLEKHYLPIFGETVKKIKAIYIKVKNAKTFPENLNTLGIDKVLIDLNGLDSWEYSAKIEIRLNPRYYSRFKP